MTMYSYAGPVIEVPSAFLATGSVIVVLKLELSVPAAASHPLHTIVYPRGARNVCSGLVEDAGSLPPVERLNVAYCLPPRFGGS